MAAYNISINGHTVQLFDQADSNRPRTATDTDWLLVKFDQPVTYDFKVTFRQDHDLEIHEKIDENNVYLCKYVPHDLSPVIDNSSTTHLTLYPDAAVAARGLIPVPTPGGPAIPDAGTTGTTSATDDSVSLAIALHPNPSQNAQQVLHEIETRFGAEHLDSVVEPTANLVRVKLDRRHIPAVAAIDSVRSISEVSPVSLFSIKACGEVGTNSLTKSFKWDGSGETVHVGDTGFDKGSTTDVHPAFTGRVRAVVPAAGKTDASDSVGHGTHVAGSVLGDLSPSGGTELTEMKGTAPKSNLVALAVDFSQTPTVPLDFFTKVVGTLPKPIIHTNSWGLNMKAQLEYQQSQHQPAQYQQFPYAPDDAYLVDDAMSKDPDLCILFAAGNNGWYLSEPSKRQQQVSTWSTSKNSIVVGASQNTRPIDNDGKFTITGTVHPSSELTQFSSRGPTAENRLGIDVVAPGQVVLSACSRSISSASLTEFHNQYGETTTKDLLFASGTSMATPAVAGCVACLRQAYRQTYNTGPSGAMLKALIIHGAVDLKGTTFTNTVSATTSEPTTYTSKTLIMTAAPNTFQGYGLVNMPNSVVPLVSPITATKGVKDGTAGSGKVVVQKLTLPSGVKSLVVTLAYSDPPGAVLQNVIGLQLQPPGSAAPISPLKPNDPLNQAPPISFSQNNVAKIVVPNPTAGDYQIVLNIQTASQTAPYAVVWSAV